MVIAYDGIMSTLSNTSTNAENQGRPFWFIAEDDPDDQCLMLDALLEINVASSNIQLVANGQQLIESLRAKADLPCIILLDLNMPLMDGWEALSIIKSDMKLKLLPTIVFTTSTDQSDINKAYKSGVNSYFAKPNLYSDLKDILSTIDKYWMQFATLPT